jgi:hypothetical protein
LPAAAEVGALVGRPALGGRRARSRVPPDRWVTIPDGRIRRLMSSVSVWAVEPPWV